MNVDVQAEYQRYADGSIGENELIRRLREWVRSIAWRKKQSLPFVVSLDELVADGLVGLMNAVRKFDPERGVRFANYALIRVVCEIRDGIRQRDWQPRLMRKRGDTRKMFQLGGLDLTGRDPPSARTETEDFWRVACRGLNKADRLTLLMYYRDGLSLKRIANDLHCSESRVSQRLAGIIERLGHRDRQCFV